jgi:hypothetical protein
VGAVLNSYVPLILLQFLIHQTVLGNGIVKDRSLQADIGIIDLAMSAFPETA